MYDVLVHGTDADTNVRNSGKDEILNHTKVTIEHTFFFSFSLPPSLLFFSSPSSFGQFVRANHCLWNFIFAQFSGDSKHLPQATTLCIDSNFRTIVININERFHRSVCVCERIIWRRNYNCVRAIWAMTFPSRCCLFLLFKIHFFSRSQQSVALSTRSFQ